MALSEFLPSGKLFAEGGAYLPFYTAVELLAILVSFMVFGLSYDLRVGKTNYDFVDRDVAESFLEMDQKVATLGSPSISAERLTFKSGEYGGVYETTKTPIFDGNHVVLGIIGIAHNITVMKRIQTELSLANDKLEEKVNQRTAQLRDAKKPPKRRHWSRPTFLPI